MQKQKYDWLFIFAVVLVLTAFFATSIQTFGGDNNSILAVIAAIGGLLSNIAASRFERKEENYNAGKLNSWLVGTIAAAVLFVVFNAIIFIVGFSLLSLESQFVQRHEVFVNDYAHFGEFVVLSASTLAALFMSIASVVAGAGLIARSRRHLVSTLVASLGYVGIGLTFRIISLLHGDLAQLNLFEPISWEDTLIGVLLNLSIVSSMLWLGVVLVRGRQT